jgi:aminoglycoside 3-N-acetyltransferase
MRGTRASLARDLRALGVREGQVILVRAAARTIGPIVGGMSPAIALREACLAAVGPSGGLIGLTFTGSFYAWERGKARSRAFHAGLPATTGAFAQSILDHPNSMRSTHPTNSFGAIGEAAHAIVRDHDRNSTSFAPISKLVANGGQMLLIGCAQSSPGFSTVHYVQEELGLAERTLFQNRLGAWESTDDRGLQWAASRDVAGCSRGFGKFYREYVEAGALRTGLVGAAYSVMIDAAIAAQIERARLAQTPQYALCDDAGCVACGSRTYAPLRMARLAMRMPSKLIARLVRG